MVSALSQSNIVDIIRMCLGITPPKAMFLSSARMLLTPIQHAPAHSRPVSRLLSRLRMLNQVPELPELI